MTPTITPEALEGLAHEIWAAAQLAPGEGFLDGTARIKIYLGALTKLQAAPAADGVPEPGHWFHAINTISGITEAQFRRIEEMAWQSFDEDSEVESQDGETLVNVMDCESGPEGAWYCEKHPDALQGHGGCDGAGIPACARLALALNWLRLARQQVRELHAQYGFLAESAIADNPAAQPQAEQYSGVRITDEKGRPMTYWGGKAAPQGVDLGQFREAVEYMADRERGTACTRYTKKLLALIDSQHQQQESSDAQ